MKLRKTSQHDLHLLNLAEDHARQAVQALRQARATKAANAIARSRKSIGGAIRHAQRCIDRQNQEPAAMVPAALADKLNKMTRARTKREYDRARK